MCQALGRPASTLHDHASQIWPSPGFSTSKRLLWRRGNRGPTEPSPVRHWKTHLSDATFNWHISLERTNETWKKKRLSLCTLLLYPDDRSGKHLKDSRVTICTDSTPSHSGVKTRWDTSAGPCFERWWHRTGRGRKAISTAWSTVGVTEL